MVGVYVAFHRTGTKPMALRYLQRYTYPLFPRLTDHHGIPPVRPPACSASWRPTLW
ncbi:hypothetical protein CBM2609_B90010 [Cupriavidus taiwanensis]|nr:hypothetical protein CBM2604_B80010 [Cupriavidus taiwanensis]SOZ33535.1 hypothetical protein CBM2609_B90010 [Cupriavidus taiwanensis]SOZ48809.1 hypothetical protein CBM2610_B70010 [Cupriavidus taiwanensis]